MKGQKAAQMQAIVLFCSSGPRAVPELTPRLRTLWEKMIVQVGGKGYKNSNSLI